jgi:hypothetical protein
VAAVRTTGRGKLIMARSAGIPVPARRRGYVLAAAVLMVMVLDGTL